MSTAPVTPANPTAADFDKLVQGAYDAAGLTVNKVATGAQVSSILTGMSAPKTGSKQAALLQFVFYCANNGSSAKTSFNGDAGGVPLNEIAHLCRTHAGTVRRVCMYFSKYVWNHYVDTDTAPANWLARGFTEESKRAAFDFFNGVCVPAALTPAKGLSAMPSVEEIRASNANATQAILESRVDAVWTTNGRVTTEQQLRSSMRQIGQ